MKKFLSIGPAYPLRGGIADFNETLTRNLCAQGFEASIVSYSTQYPSFLFPGKTQYSTAEKPSDVDIETVLHSYNPQNWLRVVKYVVHQKPAVLLLHFWMPFFAPALGFIAKRVKKLLPNITICAICHNFLPHERSRFDVAFATYLATRCDCFVAMSQSVVADIERYAPNKRVLYTPHPMYDNFGEAVSKAQAAQELNLPADASYVLFFGLVRAYKGLDLLLQAFAQKALIDKKIMLLVAGEFYENPELYYKQIRELGIEDRVIIHNEFIAHDRVRYYFSLADIVAQTYHSATQSGITQIAFHFNVPMLVTNVGGLSEIVKQGEMGYVCEKNPAKIAAALADFYENNRAETFRNVVEREKHYYTWETFVQRLAELTL
ncbi:MAG: glycosyltransferase [Bacteroidales bacterium]|jgi:glycosyltransferase involved in cell wall biosynthesis|nr:glycosyltransferase [Bacteroidales bacterium]